MLAPTQPVLLVDGDVVAYRCAASAEKTYYAVTEGNSKEAAYYDNHKEAKVHADEVGGWIWSRKEVQPEEFALQSCKTVLNSLLEKFPDSEDMIIYLSGVRNFRDFIWKTKKYKGNRDAVSRPTHLAACREYLSRVWGARTTDGYEADDALGIELSAVGDAGIVVSNDKDLDQLAGWHFNWVTGETYRITRRDSDCFLHEQILSGDATDNVPGGWGLLKQGDAWRVRRVVQISLPEYRAYIEIDMGTVPTPISKSKQISSISGDAPTTDTSLPEAPESEAA